MENEIPVSRCYLAEMLGTFILTLVDAGVGVSSTLAAQGEISLAARAAAPGFAVLAIIFALGELSGAHVNPAVTLSFAVRGVFPWRKVPIYWCMQILGATFAGALLWFLFKDTGNVGATEPLEGVFTSFVIEIVLSFILISVILSTAHQHKIRGTQAAFPVAAAITMCGLLGKPISGASMNPARSFGPALMSGHLDSYWIYLFAPMIGALFAVVTVRVIHGPPKTADEESAQGEKQKLRR